MVRMLLLLLLGASPAAARPPATADLMRDGLAAYEAGDHAAARTLLRQAAARNVAAAETLLGVMAANGEGGPASDAVAAAWFLRAARRGYAPAQLALADRFARGRGVPRDARRARLLARAAAAHDLAGASDVLGRTAAPADGAQP